MSLRASVGWFVGEGMRGPLRERERERERERVSESLRARLGSVPSLSPSSVATAASRIFLFTATPSSEETGVRKRVRETESQRERARESQRERKKERESERPS